MNDLLESLKKLQDQTKMFDKVSERGMKNTPPGMAHWLGSGPKGKTCRQCLHYTNEGRYIANSPKHALGELMDGRCRKYWQLMNKKGPKFKYRAAACKHFKENPNPPDAIKRS